MGILEESKESRTNGLGFWRSKKFIALLSIVLLAGGAYVFWPDNSKSEETAVEELKEWTVKTDDIVVAVEADGQVVAEDGVELSFAVNDDNLEVSEVYVKEGDTVQKGDEIASVETDDLQLSLSSAWASYQSALADYNETIDGATDEDKQNAKDKITSAEISLEQAKISLENTKQNAEDSIYSKEQALEDAEEDLDNNRDELSSEDVKDAYESLVDTIKSINISLDGILGDSDEIIGVDNEMLNDDFEDTLGAEDLSSLKAAKSSYSVAKEYLDELNSLALPLTMNGAYSDIEKAQTKAEETLTKVEAHLYDMKVMLDASVTSSDLSQNKLDTFVSNIAANRNSINTKITSLNTKLNAVDDAKDKLDDYLDDYEDAQRDLEIAKEDAERDIQNSEASVESKELSLAQAKRDYEELLEPLTAAERASANSKLNSASVSLKKAQNNLEDATIISPIEGQIVELNYKAGDIIVDDNKSVAVILNSETLYLKVDAEEADVSKLKVGQKAVATFDALDELELNGEISFISLTSDTSNNGIVTYEVRVVIDNPSEQEIREGMTVALEFVSSEVRDVLTAPVSAVRNVSGKPSVQISTGEWVAVTTGFTDGKYVEIIAGVSKGDKIVY